jgi:hypothetical protein
MKWMQKMLTFLTSFYNALPEVTHKSINRWKGFGEPHLKNAYDKIKIKESRRKGPRHSNEVIFNHPRKDFHHESKS